MSLAASEMEEWAGNSEDPTHLPSLEPTDARAGMNADLFCVLSKAIEEVDLEWAPPDEQRPPTHPAYALPLPQLSLQ